MISHIDIKDFAVIKDLSLDLEPGLNIITGETGAGKSVIIEAISMALGARADTDYIRHGADKAVISMLIDSKEEQYLLKREISQGKTVCRVNGELVSLGELSALCKSLVDIHGQYDNQRLLNPDNHMDILDLFGGEEIAGIKADTALKYQSYADASMELRDLRKKLSDSDRQKDFMRFELEEIKAADPKPNEDEELSEQIKLMENSEAIFSALSEAESIIYSGDGDAFSKLGYAIRGLSSFRDFSSELKDIYERFNDAYYALEDLQSDLRRQKEGISFSPAELDEAIERSELLNKLKKKYGGSLEAVIEYAEKAEKSLNQIENSDKLMSELERKISQLKAEYDAYAGQLSSKRTDAARQLEGLINKELSELNFFDAVFAVSFGSCTPSASGIDTVEFLISANKGEDPKPLAKVASGGELSRIMLALKRIIGDIDETETMIFDEIDAGISGATAGVVGNKLRSISKNHQIVCITHLPQIAAMGDFHYRIEKHSDEISTETTVVPLTEDERTEELARLLSGTVITESARMQAKELLKSK